MNNIQTNKFELPMAHKVLDFSTNASISTVPVSGLSPTKRVSSNSHVGRSVKRLTTRRGAALNAKLFPFDHRVHRETTREFSFRPSSRPPKR